MLFLFRETTQLCCGIYCTLNLRHILLKTSSYSQHMAEDHYFKSLSQNRYPVGGGSVMIWQHFL